MTSQLYLNFPLGHRKRHGDLITFIPESAVLIKTAQEVPALLTIIYELVRTYVRDRPKAKRERDLCWVCCVLVSL
jgi:hypothetical protein